MTNMFDIIKGLDGSYIVREGKLFKIVKVEYSENYFIDTGGFVIYELEDGQIIQAF